MINQTLQKGFTLIEIAIVLVIVTVLLGFTVALFPIQQELKQYQKAESEIDLIIEELIGYAQVNGRLPCPDTDNDGLENFADNLNNDTGAVGGDGVIDGCAGYFGFVPSGTLGLSGDINENGQLQDPWGVGYGYAVSDVNTDSDSVPATGAAIDLVSPDGIREEGLSNVTPDLFICDDSDTLGNDETCLDAGANPVVGNVAVVVISLGKSNALGAGPSNIQQENLTTSMTAPMIRSIFLRVIAMLTVRSLMTSLSGYQRVDYFRK